MFISVYGLFPSDLVFFSVFGPQVKKLVLSDSGQHPASLGHHATMETTGSICVVFPLAQTDLATIGFFLHYRSLFRMSTFKPENIGVILARLHLLVWPGAWLGWHSCVRPLCRGGGAWQNVPKGTSAPNVWKLRKGSFSNQKPLWWGGGLLGQAPRASSPPPLPQGGQEGFFL